MIKVGIVTNVIGIILMVLGSFMLTALPFSFYYESHDEMSIIYAAITTFLIGLILWLLSRKSKGNLGKREGFLIGGLGWISISAFSALPYLLCDLPVSFTDAIFESVSGLTTTGASIINDIEALPKGILFWRSLTQWLGGMGIIVLTVAILPLLGFGGVQLFVAEVPGPTSDKIHPRIKETAKRLWGIYVGLTLLLTLLLYLGGMGFYDAINHGLTTMATGGFSTKNASIAYFDTPFIQYILTLFMFIAGINYTVIYFSLKGNFKRVWKSEEFRTYLFLVAIIVLGVTLAVFQVSDSSVEKTFRDSIFQVVSILTTTGFVSADYTSWSTGLTLVFFGLLFTGACAGSTSGGIKVIRHLIVARNSFLELKRLLHPKAIIRTKIDDEVIDYGILAHIYVFLFFYLSLFVIGSIIMAAILSDFDQPLLSSMGAVATSLGNVGPSIGDLGPVDNFAQVPAAGKWVLVFLMLLGRLELFTILILFTPSFWGKLRA